MGWVAYWLVDALDPAGPKPKLAKLFAEELIWTQRVSNLSPRLFFGTRGSHTGARDIMSRGMKLEPTGLHSERAELLSEGCV